MCDKRGYMTTLKTWKTDKIHINHDVHIVLSQPNVVDFAKSHQIVFKTLSYYQLNSFGHIMKLTLIRFLLVWHPNLCMWNNVAPFTCMYCCVAYFQTGTYWETLLKWKVFEFFLGGGQQQERRKNGFTIITQRWQTDANVPNLDKLVVWIQADLVDEQFNDVVWTEVWKLGWNMGTSVDDLAPLDTAIDGFIDLGFRGYFKRLLLSRGKGVDEILSNFILVDTINDCIDQVLVGACWSMGEICHFSLVECYYIRPILDVVSIECKDRHIRNWEFSSVVPEDKKSIAVCPLTI